MYIYIILDLDVFNCFDHVVQYDVVGLKRRHGPSCWMATWLFAMLRAGALS
jgi:hypothetical protein